MPITFHTCEMYDDATVWHGPTLKEASTSVHRRRTQENAFLIPLAVPVHLLRVCHNKSRAVPFD